MLAILFLFPWDLAFFLLNVKPVKHQFGRILSAWKLKKRLAPKHFVPSNIVNYARNLNRSNTNSVCPYLPSTFFFVPKQHLIFCCLAQLLLLTRAPEQDDHSPPVRPQAPCCPSAGCASLESDGSSQMCTQRALLPALTLETLGWERRSVLFFLIKKEELKKNYSSAPVLLEELRLSFSRWQRPPAVKGVFLHQNRPKDLAGSRPITSSDNHFSLVYCTPGSWKDPLSFSRCCTLQRSLVWSTSPSPRRACFRVWQGLGIILAALFHGARLKPPGQVCSLSAGRDASRLRQQPPCPSLFCAWLKQSLTVVRETHATYALFLGVGAGGCKVWDTDVMLSKAAK